MPDELEYAQIVEADESLRRGYERPAFEGLEVLSYEDVRRVLEWVEQNVEPSRYTAWGRTSENLAACCGRDLKIKHHVSNLAMKSAMHLCGHEPINAAHEIAHYRIRYKGGKK